MISWKEIVQYGIKPEMDELEKNRVALTNKVGLIASPIIGIPFTINLLFYHAPIIILIVLWVICLCAFLTPWVSKYFSANVAKALGVVEFCIGALVISLMISNGKQPEIDFFLTISTAIMSAIMPMLFYTPDQKKTKTDRDYFCYYLFYFLHTSF